jgi:hypothetical protein
MKTMLSRSLIALAAAGLLAAVFAARPHIPGGSAPLRAHLPSTPAHVPSEATTPPNPRGTHAPARNNLIAHAVASAVADSHERTTRPADEPGFGSRARLVDAYLFLLVVLGNHGERPQ